MFANGFLGYNASFMLDFVVTALVGLVPLLLFSLYVVRYFRNYRLHRTLQLVIGLILLVAVILFEVDMQWVHGGWENIVNKDPDAPRLTGDAFLKVRQVLRLHLLFAVTTPLIWGVTLGLAWKKFPHPPVPGRHSRMHKLLGWLSVIDLIMTALTGIWFYYLAFVV